MSQLGYSRRFDRVPTTSGLPDKQTFLETVGMSQSAIRAHLKSFLTIALPLAQHS